MSDDDIDIRVPKWLAMKIVGGIIAIATASGVGFIGGGGMTTPADKVVLAREEADAAKDKARNCWQRYHALDEVRDQCVAELAALRERCGRSE